ncbi:MAG: PTS sugar transporter subunit IIA [Lactobacillus sp.]|jgi:mannitol/fructose-specific phosphotransferase system IIA component (Ntr-type)|nr:PTS sugar transporter subunit IIA [Lactobacillus sp.]MCI2031900.1 PTS sugar transporter subunit IIA [Lactobacillus sp.]
MFALLKKQVSVDNSLSDPSELTAIAKLAGFAGMKLDLATQELRSGFLASEALGAHVLAEHIAVTHASSASVKVPETVVMSFAQPLAWGTDQQIDMVVAVIVPDTADTDAIMAQALDAVQAHAADLTQAQASAGALEKIRRQLLA